VDEIQQSAQLLAEEIRLLEREVELKEGLPHLYGMPWYEWAWDFFTTENRSGVFVRGEPDLQEFDADQEVY
jgi:hypothetical protein